MTVFDNIIGIPIKQTLNATNRNTEENSIELEMCVKNASTIYNTEHQIHKVYKYEG